MTGEQIFGIIFLLVGFLMFAGIVVTMEENLTRKEGNPKWTHRH